MLSIKIERLNHRFAIEISNIIREEMKDERINFVTITDVDITNDLSHAKVYITVLRHVKRWNPLRIIRIFKIYSNGFRHLQTNMQRIINGGLSYDSKNDEKFIRGKLH